MERHAGRAHERAEASFIALPPPNLLEDATARKSLNAAHPAARVRLVRVRVQHARAPRGSAWRARCARPWTTTKTTSLPTTADDPPSRRVVLLSRRFVGHDRVPAPPAPARRRARLREGRRRGPHPDRPTAPRSASAPGAVGPGAPRRTRCKGGEHGGQKAVLLHGTSRSTARARSARAALRRRGRARGRVRRGRRAAAV